MRRQSPAAPPRPSRQPCDSKFHPRIIIVILKLTGTEQYPCPLLLSYALHPQTHHLSRIIACTCIPSHLLVFRPMPICFRRYLLALICFALTSFLFLPPPLLSFSHTHPSVYLFLLRSGLVLVFAGGATRRPARAVRFYVNNSVRLPTTFGCSLAPTESSLSTLHCTFIAPLFVSYA